MIFKLTRTSDPWNEEEKEIELSDFTALMLLQEREGELIIMRDSDGNPMIEIYDDHRE